MPDKRYDVLEPVVVRRRGNRWRPQLHRLRLARPQPRLCHVAARWSGRRECGFPPLGFTLARRPVRSLSFVRLAHVDARSWSASTTIVQAPVLERRVLGPTQAAAPSRIDGSPHAATPRGRTVPATVTLLRPLLKTLVGQQRTRLQRVERIEREPGVPGVAGSVGPRGPGGPAATVPMVLVRPSAPVSAPTAVEHGVPSSPAALELVRGTGPRAPEPTPTPDVEQLTTQVLRRIERRAIAQRERLGGVL